MKRSQKGKGTPYPWPDQKLRQWYVKEDRGAKWIAQKLGVSVSGLRKHLARIGCRANRTGPKAGRRHHGWKGGRHIDKDGYVLAYQPDHPHARYGRYVLEHRLVMEKQLGRLLHQNEVVHHKNGDKQDNRPENLQVFEKNSDHLRHELSGQTPNWTKEGRQKTLDGVRKYLANLPASGRDAKGRLQSKNQQMSQP